MEFRRVSRTVSGTNAVAPYPSRARFISADRSSLLMADSKGVSIEKGPISVEAEKRNVFSFMSVEGQDGFLLRNLKTQQCLGCLSRAGQMILHGFENTINRSRELVWVKVVCDNGTFALYNTCFELYIGPTETQKQKTLGCIVMVEDFSQAFRFYADPVKFAWSFNSGPKAITAQMDGSLMLQPKGIFSWAPYFEFVEVGGGPPERFSLRVARPVSDELQYVSVVEDSHGYRVSLVRTPDSFVLVPTLKAGSFYVRHCLTKRLLGIQDAQTGLIGATESAHNSLTLSLLDVKGIEFLGQVSEMQTSEHWMRMKEQLEKFAKNPIAHPVYSHLPNVLEREMSWFSSLYFTARCNGTENVVRFCNEMRAQLNSREKVLLANAESSFNMIPAIMAKDTPLFKALDKAVANAKQAVSLSDQLFTKYAELDPPHVTNLKLDDTFCRIAIAGDFGTGKPKAKQMLDALFGHEETRPHVFIHLGDVYKKGTAREQLENFIQPLHDAINKHPGHPVCVFDLPGNHDYIHKGGEGFFWALDELNRRNLTPQRCSFFCVNVGEKFCLIGLDTSLNSLNFESDSLETHLNEEQRIWLKQRMEEVIAAGRSIILLSHHPVLSCGPLSYGQMNAALWNELAPYMNHIKAWFWGHEHSFKLYEPYTGNDGNVLTKGRLIGHSAKWKRGKNNVIPSIAVDHPKAREIGVALLEFSGSSCRARYVELAGENETLTLVENYKEDI